MKKKPETPKEPKFTTIVQLLHNQYKIRQVSTSVELVSLEPIENERETSEVIFLPLQWVLLWFTRKGLQQPSVEELRQMIGTYIDVSDEVFVVISEKNGLEDVIQCLKTYLPIRISEVNYRVVSKTEDK